jgi:sirohydrochlorin cobaltochelatase
MKKSNLKLAALALACLPVLGFLACAGGASARTDKPVVLVVSFGTSYAETRDKTIGAIENAITNANPNYEVRRAFTSQIIINVLRRRDRIRVDNVDEAMKRLVRDKVKEVIIQPTHVMPGFEYDDTINEIKPYEKQFTSIRYGRPLLSSDQDFQETAAALINYTQRYTADDTAVLFMGHGTEHHANEVYHKLDALLKERGNPRYFVGTVESEPTLEDIMRELRPLGLRRTTLLPLMIVAGDHANNDMAGDEEDSWKSILEHAGYGVQAVLRGLGEYPEVQNIFVRHVREAR